MNDKPFHETNELPTDEAAAAFCAMREELALLRAAVGGFAVRQEELAARDYTPDLARLISLQDEMVGTLEALSQRPALAQTPQSMAAEIEAATKTARRADHEVLAEATRQHAEAARQLNTTIARVKTARDQLDSRIWAWLFGAGTVILLLMLPQLIDALRG